LHRKGSRSQRLAESDRGGKKKKALEVKRGIAFARRGGKGEKKMGRSKRRGAAGRGGKDSNGKGDLNGSVKRRNLGNLAGQRKRRWRSGKLRKEKGGGF